MKKNDAIISLIIGFLIGIFALLVLKTLEIKIYLVWLILIICPILTFLGLFLAWIIKEKFFLVYPRTKKIGVTIYQLIKFTIVGALNTLVDLGILNFLMWVFGIYSGILYSFFKGISFLVATVNSYLWNKHWTFEKKEKAFVPKEYIKFLVIVTIGLLINVIIASLLVNIFSPPFGIEKKFWANLGAFLAIFVSAGWNFLGAKFIVFKK